MSESNRALAAQLRSQAAEAVRTSKLVPEGTRAALEKIAADLLAEAVRLETAACGGKPSDRK